RPLLRLRARGRGEDDHPRVRVGDRPAVLRRQRALRADHEGGQRAAVVRDPAADQPRALRDPRAAAGDRPLAAHLGGAVAVRGRSALDRARTTGGGVDRRPPGMIEVVALDGDDTLWHSEQLFVDTQAAFRELVAPYVRVDDEDLDALLLEVERRNLPTFGYG